MPWLRKINHIKEKENDRMSCNSEIGGVISILWEKKVNLTGVK